MKNTHYIFGIIILNIIFLADILKLSHLPGAGVLITLGLVSLTFIFLPISYFKLKKSTDDKLLKLVYLAAFLTFLIDLLGFLFKIQHWPGAAWLITFGIPMPFILFLPIYIHYHNKRKLKADRNFFGILFFMLYLAVFSSFLTVNTSHNLLDNQSRMADNLRDLNGFLEEFSDKQDNSKSELIESCNLAIQELNFIKKSLIESIDGTSSEAIDSEGKISAVSIFGKDKRYTYYYLDDENINHWELFLKEYKNIQENIQKNNLYSKLVQIQNESINTWVHIEDNLYSFIGSDVSNQINLLTDWQNKLLIIKFYLMNVANQNEIAQNSN